MYVHAQRYKTKPQQICHAINGRLFSKFVNNEFLSKLTLTICVHELKCKHMYIVLLENWSARETMIIPPTTWFNEVEKGYSGFTSVHPSVCLPVCPSLRLSVNKIVSALYLPQYLPDPFHISTTHQATSAGVYCVKVIAKFYILNLWIYFNV